MLGMRRFGLLKDPYTSLIDNKTTLGLDGTSNSLSYRVHEIEKHFHNTEHWYGIAGSPTATIWGEYEGLNAYTAISGAGDWGGDANDEALVLGTDDTPNRVGKVKFDVHRVLVVSLSEDDPFIFRVVYGSGTMADALTAQQESCFMVQNNPAGSKAGGFPVEVMMPRVRCGIDQIWIQIKTTTNNATATFFVGIHEYQG